MGHVILTGRLHAVMSQGRAVCTFYPDPHQAVTGLSQQGISIDFGDDLRAIMLRHSIPRRMGTAELFDDPACVCGVLSCESDRAHIHSVSSFEVVTSAVSYRPNRVYSVSYVVFPTANAEFGDWSTVLPSHNPDNHPMRIRGILVANPNTNACWLTTSKAWEQPSPESGSVSLDCDIAYILKNHLPWSSPAPDPNDFPLSGGWATVQGAIQSHLATNSQVVSDITLISIETPGCLRRIWWDPPSFRWHTQMTN